MTAGITKANPRQNHSGRWMVLAMFAFASTVTGAIYLYWHLHTAPFRPLQEALAEEYPGSHPLVQGGREKIHKGTPSKLRVTLRVEFDPSAEENANRTNQVFDRTVQLADNHLPLSQYEMFELHLVHMRPEQEPQLDTIIRSIAEIGVLKSPDNTR